MVSVAPLILKSHSVKKISPCRMANDRPIPFLQSKRQYHVFYFQPATLGPVAERSADEGGGRKSHAGKGNPVLP